LEAHRALTSDLVLSITPVILARPELGPLAHAVLSRDGRLDALPLEVRTAARTEYFASLARATVLQSRLGPILDAAAAERVELLPIKGAVFSTTLYADLPGARPLSDLDLVVRPRDLERAARLLESLGYERLYAPRARFEPEHGHDVAFRGHGAHVELHYKLHHELAIDPAVDTLFDRAIEIELVGARRRVPAWDDHLCLVAVHAATHALADTPIWIFDLALILERAPAALDGAEAEAAQRRVSAAFWAALETAHRQLPSMIPSPQTQPRAARTRARLLDRLLGVERLATRPSQLTSLAVRAVLTDDLRDALKELRRKAKLRLVEIFETRT
jgi:hypothetical protein